MDRFPGCVKKEAEEDKQEKESRDETNQDIEGQPLSQKKGIIPLKFSPDQCGRDRGEVLLKAVKNLQEKFRRLTLHSENSSAKFLVSNKSGCDPANSNILIEKLAPLAEMIGNFPPLRGAVFI